MIYKLRQTPMASCTAPGSAPAKVLGISGRHAIWRDVSPEVAALSMSGSTLIVAINALMLKRTKLAGIRQPAKTPAPRTPDVAATPSPGGTPAVAAKPAA